MTCPLFPLQADQVLTQFLQRLRAVSISFAAWLKGVAPRRTFSCRRQKLLVLYVCCKTVQKRCLSPPFPLPRAIDCFVCSWVMRNNCALKAFPPFPIFPSFPLAIACLKLSLEKRVPAVRDKERLHESDRVVFVEQIESAAKLDLKPPALNEVSDISSRLHTLSPHPTIVVASNADTKCLVM